jgi:hypothetical protein
MLIDGIIPDGERVRRSYSFERGQKGLVNRAYRALVDRTLARRHRTTDFFFDLNQCLRFGWLDRVFDLAQTCAVEMMVHPIFGEEYTYLMSDACAEALGRVGIKSYASL